MDKAHIWLRAETKPQEQRTALTPHGVKQLLDAGFKVTVERSKQNIFSDSDYQATGAELVVPGLWKSAPDNAIILGLKELPNGEQPLTHQHIYFAHAYKEQSGWQSLLNRFKQGGGLLYDLEYLVDENQRRIAAFGYWAGFAGAALAVLAWANQQNNVFPSLKNIASYENKQQLIEEIKSAFKNSTKKPTVMVIGAKGRSGSGAVDLAKALSLPTIEWDLEETRRGGPFTEINDADILVNCVLVNQDIPPFVDKAMINIPTRILSVIADVSCDPYGSYNPIRIYNDCTTFAEPCISIDEKNRLELIAIDHLPSLLPKESSEDYEQQLLPHLMMLQDKTQGVWPRALKIFNEKIEQL